MAIGYSKARIETCMLYMAIGYSKERIETCMLHAACCMLDALYGKHCYNVCRSRVETVSSLDSPIFKQSYSLHGIIVNRAP